MAKVETLQDKINKSVAKAKIRYSQKQIATLTGITTKKQNQWLAGKQHPTPEELKAYQTALFGTQAPKTPTNKAEFTFIDLFAGIGGIRLGFEAAGGRCVFTSEWNTYSQKTYSSNFKDTHTINGDITQIDAASIPDHDVLVGGFPCQAFSISGKRLGFQDTRGTLFFDVARIIKEKQPKAFMLENVKNLVSHDKGNTFKVIKDTLEKDLGYTIQCRVISSQSFVPQHRERIIIVGFKDKNAFDFDKLILADTRPTLDTILHPQDGTETLTDPFIFGTRGKVLPKYTLTPKLWTYLQNHAAKHKAAGNGFGFGLVTSKDVARTLSARYYKDGSEILISQGKKKTPRRLTPRECARLMGFPNTYHITVSDMQAYKQFGNSVVVPVIKAVAMHMKPHIVAAVKAAPTSTTKTSNP